jgi:hypothetical protein
MSRSSFFSFKSRASARLKALVCAMHYLGSLLLDLAARTRTRSLVLAEDSFLIAHPSGAVTVRLAANMLTLAGRAQLASMARLHKFVRARQ